MINGYRILLGVAVACVALLLAATSAFADYEQVPEHFGASGEAAQLERARAMAVNFAGTGEVEAGSLYVVGVNARVLRFSAGSEGEAPQFREAWGWGIGNEAEEFQRCGPAYAAEPRPANSFPTCKPVAGNVVGGEEVGHFDPLYGVAVDQATGDVYVLNAPFSQRSHHLIEVFTANGTPIGEGFGDQGRITPFPSESIAEGPDKLHDVSNGEGEGIAVDEDGTVYVRDNDFGNAPLPRQTRMMTFEPEHAGDYEQYVYAGQEKDITTPSLKPFTRIALVGSSRLVALGGQLVREYETGGGSSPICSSEVSGGAAVGLTVNPLTGEVFYFVNGAHPQIRRLGPCDATTGEFAEVQVPVMPKPETVTMFGLAFNPVLNWSPRRPAGVLYGADAGSTGGEQKGIGDVFAPAEVRGPAILSESATNTTSSSSTLKAQIDPHGSATTYRFQYLPQTQYESNEPDERQSVSVRAMSGLFGLGFEGLSFGGVATATLASGSKTAANLVTAGGTATVHAAKGTATLHGAVGKGTVISGSNVITAASAAEGSFAIGQTVTGAGIPAGTTIGAISGSELTLSASAAVSAANTPLNAGTTSLTAAHATEGAFEVGMSIAGAGIPEKTTITAVLGATLTLSKPVTKPGTGIEIKAGSTTLDGLSVSEGSFVAGQPIAGEGIAAGTTIKAIEGSSLQLSDAPTKPGTGVPITSSGPAPLAVGETVEGPGVASGTMIVAAKAGELTLSQPATASGSGVHLRAGLPFNASAAEMRKALEGLSTIGQGNVEVSGGPGDESGSHPYEITYVGDLANQDLLELSAEAAGLSGGSASIVVAALHDGGGGFSGAAEVPTPSGALGGGGIATAPVSGLDAETAYRFRVVASSECKGTGEPLCEALGSPASFTTYPMTAAGLPDRRAYELVSPAQKHGGEVFLADPRISSCGECKPPPYTDIFAVLPMQSAADGESVSYGGYPFSSTEGAAVYNSYISRRTPSGWQTTAMSPRRWEERESAVAYAGSLDEGIVQQLGAPLAEDAPSGNNLYLQTTDSPAALRPLLTDALFEAHPPHREAGQLVLNYAGHSPDFSSQFFSANDVLTGPSAYAPEPGDPGQSGRDLYEWREGDLTLVNVLPGNTTVAVGAAFASASPDTHAVSVNGRRVYWTAGGHLYMREDGRTTREIHHAGTFLAASEDGLQVLLSDGCLYSLATATCSADLTQGSGGFLGVTGQSGDLSRIYFVDTAALTGSGQNERDEEAQAGKPNLYFYEAGVGLSFITTLDASDGAGDQLSLNDWASAPGLRTAEASPNGRYLAFASTRGLTGYANVGLCEHNADGNKTVNAPCKEVFLFDSVTGRLTCASCNPTGEAPLGNSTLRRLADALHHEWLPQPRYLTDQGRLFFDSADRLSPRDTNGGVEDVYEYEPAGVGTCARAGSCVSLISPGTGSVDSNLLAMNEGGEGADAGSDVFFTTRERLVPEDSDELFDVYDAREAGGFPHETETQRAECQGESCQPAPQAPANVTPASSTFHGAGNVKEASHRKKHKKKHPKKKHHGKKARSKKRATGHNRGGAK